MLDFGSAGNRFKGLPRQRFGRSDFPVATRPLARLLGLAFLDQERAGPGLLIPGCSSVHSFGMRFALRIYFLDRDQRPLKGFIVLPPRRFCSYPPAHSVLEVLPGVEI